MMLGGGIFCSDFRDCENDDATPAKFFPPDEGTGT